MINAGRLYGHLKEKGISFYTGVPDSLLKEFLAELEALSKNGQHIICANEGLAIALASGYHMKSGKIPLVYLQNSGLGNMINPLSSLADAEMYAIPMLLMIGWRGEPGQADEPQHKKMGRITTAMLDVLEIPFFILEDDENRAFDQFEKAIRLANEKQQPIAILVRSGIFEKTEHSPTNNGYPMVREEVIQKLIASLQGDELVVCTTGKTGREFFEQNKLAGDKITSYFLSVGAMGHANHVALGLQIEKNTKTIVLDGDGAMLMHMGSLPTVAHYGNSHFIHVLLNNGSHESVGGQPTEGFSVDFCELARSSGYVKTQLLSTPEELEQWLSRMEDHASQFVEIRIATKSREGLGRPSDSPLEMKKQLMKSLAKKKS